MWRDATAWAGSWVGQHLGDDASTTIGAADAAGTMPELDRAIFVLRRLYPEFSEAQLAHIRGDLATRQAAGTWQGFTRPSD